MKKSFAMWRNIILPIPMLIAALAFWNPPLPWLRDGTIYVSPQGSDWSSGRSVDTAVATLQRAADMVTAGETVMVLPGIYREEVRIRRGGTADKPVIFKARDPGTVTISGAAPDAMVTNLDWRSEGGKIWSAATPWPIYHAIGDNENFYHVRWANGNGDNVYHWIGKEGRVAKLRELVNRPNAWGAFTYEGDRLYVSFRDGRSPQHHKLEVNREIPRPYASWSIRSANVWVEADHVRFDGLKFHLGVGSGLLLWNARDVIVRDTMFTGAVYGVSNFPRLRLPQDVIVEHSFYNNFPQSFWRSNWLSGEEVYRHHTYSTLACLSGDGIVARHNLVTHAGDGIELSTPDSNIVKGAEIYGNLLAHGTDDGFELDGHAKRVHIHHNFVYNFPVSLGLSPVLTGPTLIRDNLFLHPINGSVGAHLKLMNPWGGRSGALAGPIRNVAVENNIFSGKWLAFVSSPVENVRVENNIFADISVDGRFELPAGVVKSGNVFVTSKHRTDSPESACKMKQNARLPRRVHQPDSIFSQFAKSDAGSIAMERPGPRWLDYDKNPASADVSNLAEQWMKVANWCE